VGTARADVAPMIRRTLPVFCVSISSLAGCSSSDPTPPPAPPPDAPALAWAAPLGDTSIRVGDPIQLAVSASHEATAVRFALDGADLATCNASADPEEDCRLGDVFRWTTTFARAGQHELSASFTAKDGSVVRATRTIDVRDAMADDEVEPSEVFEGKEEMTPEEAAALAAEPPPLTVDALSRGVRDPNRGYHNIFGGVRWAVKSDRVLVTHPPPGSVSVVTRCLARYGGSIRHWADHYKLSRATVVATAIAESSCTDPVGSSDGLSSGPLQVTASTCAALTGLSPHTCRVRMHTHPDFSFEVGSKYMASSFQVRQHHHDPPKIGAAYNAGTIRPSTANRWHMLTTGNHINRWVGGYNAYRRWESIHHVAAAVAASEPEASFEGKSVATFADLPATAPEGEVIFVGDFIARDGDFAEFREGRWLLNSERE
jgi:hypothetical protein